MTEQEAFEALSAIGLDIESPVPGFESTASQLYGPNDEGARVLEVEYASTAAEETCSCPADEDEDACDFCMRGGISAREYLTIRYTISGVTATRTFG